MGRREGCYVFPAKKWNLAECLWRQCLIQSMSECQSKYNFSSLKQIYKLFCDDVERLRAEHILAAFHLAFLDSYKASGTSESNCWALLAAGKGPLCSHPGDGATGRPSSSGWAQGCSTWLVGPRWDQEEDYRRLLLPSDFSFPLSLSIYHFGFLFQKGQLWLSYHPVKDWMKEKWECDTLNTGTLGSETCKWTIKCYQLVNE